MDGRKARVLFTMAACGLGLLLFATGIRAERLPVKTYTTADGLPADKVFHIMRDSRGFLWFCTRDGLSKFDGYQFHNYGTEHGLPNPWVNDLIEASDGTYWVATNGGGLASFNPARRDTSTSGTRFRAYSLGNDSASNSVNRLCEDRDGRIWAGTDHGLFYFDKAEGRFLAGIPDLIEIFSLVVGRQGDLWIGAGSQLLRRSPDGRVVRYSFRVARDLGRIFSLLEDHKGKLWMGTWYAGLFELDPTLLPLEDSALQTDKPKGLLNQYTIVDGTMIGTVVNLHQSPDGHLWIVASPDSTISQGGGLFEFDGQRFRRYGETQGIIGTSLECLTEDNQGNFWLGSVEGVLKIAHSGFTTFGYADGLQSSGLQSGLRAIFENQAGELCLISDKGMVVNRFVDGRFIATRLNIPKTLQHAKMWGSYQITFQDRLGDWWVPTSKGLMRFAKVAQVEQLAHARPKAHYLLGNGNDALDIFRLYEDSRGDIWISLASSARNALVKWQRATETFHYYTESDGVPAFNPPTSFCEDPNGNLWIGLYGGGLLRHRAGSFTLFGSSEGLPSGLISYLYIDRNHRLWIASGSDGVGRLDDIGMERPTFVRYTMADGLSSNVISSIGEDDWGRIYFGTPRSVDRFHPVTGAIKRYTPADGLPRGASGPFRDRQGALWFLGSDLVARLVPEPDEQQLAPPILITAVRVNGDTQSIAELGETRMEGLELGPSQNHVQIDFVGLAFGAGEALEYQYKLDGADRDWQSRTSLRTVNYANLAAGTYTFHVRAMNAEGQFSPTAASVQFTILAPVWQRWWFAVSAAALAGLVAYWLHRYRIERLLELERVRTRIAADLHDDIGTGLSRIAVLSEVARHEVAGGTSRVTERLSAIASASRELIDSMSDLVWVVNPERDQLRDLTQRMRRFASDIFTSRSIEFTFRAPDEEQHLRVSADIRRQVFLIFKESVNNVVRHSGCGRAEIELTVEGSWFTLTVKDDGRGFDVEIARNGNGVANMRQRAHMLGAQIRVNSSEGRGTTITLRVPLRATVKEHNGRLHGAER